MLKSIVLLQKNELEHSQIGYTYRKNALAPPFGLSRDGTSQKTSPYLNDNVQREADLAFDDIKIHVRLKLFALWCSVMFFYIYGDYFELYQPGKLQGMLAGDLPFGRVTQGVLLGMSAIMVIPSLMPFLSLALPPGINRALNVVFGGLYTVVMVLAIHSGWHFYRVYGLIEIVLTLLIIWYAWTWPKQENR